MADLAELVSTSHRVAETPARLAKIELLSNYLSGLEPADLVIATTFLTGSILQGTIGVGWAALSDLPPPAPGSGLQLSEVDRALEAIGGQTGPGSQTEKQKLLFDLFSPATAAEQSFLQTLLLGELRQGASAGVMLEAVARAAQVPATAVRRAAMFGDLGSVARTAVYEGTTGLDAFRLEVLRPFQPMLAQPGSTLEAAMHRIEPLIEWKLDGARLQVHKQGDRVAAFTRNLASTGERIPEVLDLVRELAVQSVVLDGEVIALDRRQRPRAFQETMSRFGTEVEVETGVARTPLTAFFFDCLLLDGELLLDQPLGVRRQALELAVPPEWRIPHLATASVDEASRFLAEAISAGHEGVMVKDLDSTYQAGRRGSGWVKIKPAHTLDLVVLAVEWGHGRRQGWLSNLHLGARHPDGGFVMVGKTFKGMTDQMLAWQTERFLGLETGRDGHVVWVRPEQVVEVAFDGVQTSRRYPGGVALRFARVKGYRADKSADKADTIESLRAIRDGGFGGVS